MVNPYKLLQHETGELGVENPTVTVDYLENGRCVYYGQAKFAFPSKEKGYSFTGISSNRAEAIKMLNNLLNKKISAEDRTNFLNNNYFSLVN